MVAERVVDLLEAVEIHDQHGRLASVASRGEHGLGRAVAEQRAIRQPGEGVVERLVAVLGRLTTQPLQALATIRNSAAHSTASPPSSSSIVRRVAAWTRAATGRYGT